MARHNKVDIPHSKLQQGITEQLKSNGYIRGYRIARSGVQGLIRIYLKYKKEGAPAIERITRMSKPSKRSYVGVDQIPDARSGYGLVVLSTSKGILSGKEAKEQNVGGEVLCQIW